MQAPLCLLTDLALSQSKPQTALSLCSSRHHACAPSVTEQTRAQKQEAARFLFSSASSYSPETTHAPTSASRHLNMRWLLTLTCFRMRSPLLVCLRPTNGVGCTILTDVSFSELPRGERRWCLLEVFSLQQDFCNRLSNAVVCLPASRHISA